MHIDFDWLNDKGIKCSILQDIEPKFITESQDGWLQTVQAQRLFGFDKKSWMMVIRMFYEIKFTRHSTSSWTTEGTINQCSFWFLTPVTNSTLKPKVKYLFRLSDKGVELYNILEGFFLVEEGFEMAVEEFFKSLYDFQSEK